MTLQKYRKKPDQFVVAVQLDLDTDGLVYQKWGHQQRCVAGDWLVNNQGDCYTVSKASFAATYSEIMPGIYIKTTPVWARVALESDVVTTKEGSSDYQPGDYCVANNPGGTDAYVVSKDMFERVYEKI